MEQRPRKPFSRADRVIRVFISSTFLDMREERDHLVKFTFPRLRRICRDRNVEFIDVDLRWGVTDEQKAEGKVLSICLAEIKRCQPFFIGLLGERYGWIPGRIDNQLLQERGWLRDHDGKSVTELEVLHGVLRNPEMAEHAFFYFRDPERSREVEAEIRKHAGYRKEPAESREKLRSLKRSIEDSGFPLRPGFRDVEELDRLILRDLTRVIDELYPQGEQPDALDRESAEHEAFARSRIGRYIERGDDYGDLDDHVDADGPPLVVLGDSGVGKSALLANWAQRFRDRGRTDFLLCHFIGSSPYSADWTMMLRRIMGEFNRHLGLGLEIPDDPAGLRTAFANGLHQAAARQRIVLMLDGLNQLEDREGALDLSWLPPSIPGNVRLVLSTLPGRTLDVLEERGWPSVTVQPFDATARRRLIKVQLKKYAKSLSTDRVDRIVAAPQTGSPQFLKTLLEELRLFGEHDRLDSMIDLYLGAVTIKDLYGKILARWQEDYEGTYRGLVQDAMTCIWAARRGLSERELLEMLGRLKREREISSRSARLLSFFKRRERTSISALPTAQWAPLHLAVGDSIVERSGLIGFAHEHLREAVREAFLVSEKQIVRAHAGIAAHFRREGWNERTVDEYPWQLMRARAWPELYTLLSDPEFFGVAWQASRQEVKRYWAAVAQNSDFELREAYRPVVERPEDHREQAWDVGSLLYDTGHLELALRIREFSIAEHRGSGQRGNLAASLYNRAGILFDLGESEEALVAYAEAEEIYRALNDAGGLAMLLNSKARVLTSMGETARAKALLGEALELYSALGDEPGRADCLLSLGRLHDSGGEPDTALKLYESAEDIYRRHGNLVAVSRCAVDRASVRFDQGRRDDALRQYRKATRLYRELGDRASLNTTLHNEAMILLEQGDTGASLSIYEECETISRDLGHVGGTINALHGKAEAFQKLGRFDDALAQHAEVERICRDSRRMDQLAQCLSDQGLILHKMGDKERSRRKLAEAEEIGRKTGNTHSLAVALRDQAMLLWSRGSLEEALARSRESERLYVERDHKQGIATSMDDQATILRDLGELEESMSLMRRAETLWRELDNKIGIAVCLGNQALVLHKLGDPEGAMRIHDEEEEIYRLIGAREGLQRCIGNKGVLFESRGDLDRAMQCYEEQERIATEIGALPDRMVSIGNQALVWDMRGDRARALRMLAEAEDYHRRTPNALSLQLTLGNIGQILEEQGDLPGAMARFLEMETINKAIGHPEGLKKALRCLADVRMRLGDYESALVNVRDLAEAARSSGDDELLVSSLSRQAHIHRLKGEPHTAMELLEMEEAACRRLGREDATADCLLRQARLLLAGDERDRALATLGKCREAARMSSACEIERSALQLEIETHAKHERTDAIRVAIDRFDEILPDREDDGSRAWSLGVRAMIARIEGRIEEALELLTEQEHLLERAGNKEKLLVSLKYRIDMELDRERHREALDLYLDHERLCRELDDRGQLRESLKMQISLMMDLAVREGTPAKCLECLQLCNDASDQDGQVLCRLVMADMLRLRGEASKSSAMCREALQLLESWPDSDGKAFYTEKLHGVLGEVEGRSSVIGERRPAGDDGRIQHGIDEARSLLHEAEASYRECGDRRGLMETYHGLGVLDAQQGDLASAATRLASALEIGRELELAPHETAILITLASVRYREGNVDEAGRLYLAAERLAREADDANAMQGALFGLAVVATARRDFPKAAALYGEQKRICRSLGNAEALTMTLINEGHLLAFHMDSSAGGLALLEEARQLASEHGLTELLAKAEQLVISIRRMGGQRPA